MQVSNLPARMPVVWASSAGADYIRSVPVPSQIGITDGRASYTDGFVPDNFVNAAAGGIPPDGRDFNGVLQDVTEWLQWGQAGGPSLYNASFSTSIGGYPNGALIYNSVNSLFYVSSIDNNPNAPTSGIGWQTLNAVILANAALTGTPTTPTQPANDGSTKVANTFYADRAANNAQTAAQGYANSTFLPLTGGTLTGNLNVGNGTTGAITNINGANANFRQVRFQTVGSNRYATGIDSSAESGGNVGSMPFGQVFDDTGASLGRVWQINRATAAWQFLSSPIMPTPAAGDNSTNGATTAYVDTGGLGHTIANHSGGHSLGTTYTNTRPGAKLVVVQSKSTVASDNLIPTVDGVALPAMGDGGIGILTIAVFIVPPGSTYSVQWQTGTGSNTVWNEAYA